MTLRHRWIGAIIVPLLAGLLVSEGEAAPVDTEIVVRVVAKGAMVLGDEVGGARVTIREHATGRVLASGIQGGSAGDRNQIMRTPRLLDEPHYTSTESASFVATFALERPTRVEIIGEGPLDYPGSMQRASVTTMLLPGQDVSGDGIVLELHGYLVDILSPKGKGPLTAAADVMLKASVRTLSGNPVQPYGDWDSRKIQIYGEIRSGDRVIERLQMFFADDAGVFEAPFYVPSPAQATEDLTIRVIASNGADTNFGVAEATFPILPERAGMP